MEIKKRSEIAEKYKWDLSPILASDAEWEKQFDELSSSIDSITAYKGRLGDDATLLEFLKFNDKLSLIAENLYVYANMKYHQDTSLPTYQGLVDRIEGLLVKLSTAGSFYSPEVNLRSREQLITLSEIPSFSDYSYSLAEFARNKERILSEKEELIISKTGLITKTFKTVFSLLDNSDITFPSVTDEAGKKHPMSHGLYSVYLHSGDRKLRKHAFTAMHGAYAKLNNVLGANYAGLVKKNYFYAKLRGFDSCIERSMNGENVPKEVYDNLLHVVESGLPALQDYLQIRKKALGVSKLHCYDLYVPITADAELKLSYEDACNMVKTALRPLGEEYGALLDRAFSEKWIDVYENEGKRSGAYSWGTYAAHPYVLLNYQPTTTGVFTIAHELGHAMHSYYSNSTQPYAKAGYEIFVAEIASTVNEMLLLKYLLNTSEGDMKKYLLSYLIEMFRTTVFRQTMFAEFEKLAHELVEKDLPATAAAFNEIYYKLNEKYYSAVSLDKEITYEWSRIPHFYDAFYVYKYATGLISACAIAEGVFAGDKQMLDGYRSFLKAGGSMPPHDILKLTGVDLTNDKTTGASMRLFAETVAQLKEYYE